MIKIELDRTPAIFQPGENITGRVHWADLDPTTKKMDIRLIWYTVGKGSRDCEIVINHTVMSPAQEGQQSFQLVAPTRPHSFSGTLISLLWAIELILFPDFEAELLEISITPQGREIVLTPITDQLPKLPLFPFGSRR